MKSVKNYSYALERLFEGVFYLVAVAAGDAALGGVIVLCWDMAGLPHLSWTNGMGWVGLVALASAAVYLLVNVTLKYLRRIQRSK